MTIMSRLPPSANTRTNDEGLIFGHDFNDSYFSRDNGLEESRTVFLKGCGLPQAWANRSSFVIGELGFGTGLNVLATWDIWRKTRCQGSILHIVTVEGFLLDAQAAQATHNMWPELSDLSDRLIAKWPTRAYGAQRIWFPDDGLCITFLIGPCEEVLSRMNFQADAWFLDGFSPARNPDMWSKGVFKQIARLSAPEARLATYSVAGSVRAGLADVGFEVTRVPGFGAKRQRLEAHFVGSRVYTQDRPQTAIVIGGGIAGAAVSAALARRGVKTDLFDSDPCGRNKASGNPMALIMPRLDRADTREARFFRAAYLMAIEAYQDMGDAFSQLGVEEVAIDAQAQERLNDLLADPPLPASHFAPTAAQSIDHVTGGTIYPDAVLKHLKREATLHPVSTERVDYIDGLWHAYDSDGSLLARADICVIANGPAAGQFCDQGSFLRGRAGQLSWAAVQGKLPQVPLSGGAYASPFYGKLCFGATFEKCEIQAPPPPVQQSAHIYNRELLAGIAPDLAAQIDIDNAAGRTAVRATTADNLPIVGALESDGVGKFVLCGLGSRGFTTAFLCAEMIAAQACGEPSPVETQVAIALDPYRFHKRAAKRKAI
jgi:tRNA 5-methylaminomethyl-2-thiouridine biosynthesis bifunctional protein